jgi:ATP-dependent DNA helicase RecQ
MEQILEAVRKTWGYDQLRPLQREAIEASLAGRDALVVLPTGGGKSLCYQAPALVSPGLTVVVSPLLSLMKDQADALRARGVPAALLSSALDPAGRARVQARAAAGDVKLLFVTPERFAQPGFEDSLRAGRVRAFAVDEAHCISHWGSDFRAEYGKLGRLKAAFPDAPVHAFTATAPPRVKADILEGLRLRDPLILAGEIFRPNLRLRVAARSDPLEDAVAHAARRPGQAGIVYAIRRGDVEALVERLQAAGVAAVGYHAGMEPEARGRAQDLWRSGQAPVVAATVAFGMGIDRPDVRFVVHSAMPQSVEHYQQEVGRAGRDGKPADGILLWSPEDARVWEGLMRAQAGPALRAKLRLLGEIDRFCRAARCRHRALVEHFGQDWPGGPCGACDVCDAQREARGTGPGAAPRELDLGLYERLRDERRRIADELRVPAFQVLGDGALRELARRRPAGPDELLAIPGIGRARARAFGARLLWTLRSG